MPVRTSKKKPPKRMRVIRKPGREHVSPNSRFAPPGHRRLQVNMPKDLHHRVKLAAVRHKTTVGEILATLIARHVPEA